MENEASNTRRSSRRSAPKYPIIPEMRISVINMYFKGIPAKRIATQLSLKISSVYNIIRLAKTDNRVLPKKRGGNRRSILNIEQRNAIRSWVDENPTITLKKMCIKFEENFNFRVDDNTIDRALLQFHYSLKRLVVVPVARNSSANIELRYIFAQRFNEYLFTFSDNNFVFVDEVGFSVSSRTKRGRSLVGTVAYTEIASIRSRNISVIAAATKYGMLDYKINNSPVNGENFKDYIIFLKSKCTEKGILDPIFVIDNARIHHYSGVVEMVNELNLLMFYLPPYSPMLNIIENCFAKWKNFVVRKEARNEQELLRIIDSGFNVISSEDCNGFFRKLLRTVERCRLREEFNE